jgi:hypothetical protein
MPIVGRRRNGSVRVVGRSLLPGAERTCRTGRSKSQF